MGRLNEPRGETGRRTLLLHIHRTGLTIAGDLAWTEDEKRQVVDRYDDDLDGLVKALEGRSVAAIRSKAHRLGVTRDRRIWDDPQKTAFKPQYKNGVPVREIERIGIKAPRQIWSKASKMKIRRPLKPPRVTGLRLYDDVRKRAFECNFTMLDLDEGTHGKTYFRRPTGHFNLRLIARAVEMLGGTLTARQMDA